MFSFICLILLVLVYRSLKTDESRIVYVLMCILGIAIGAARADVRDLECYKNGSCVIYKVPKVERSVWSNYTGLYKLQHMSEKCARFAGPDCLKPIRTWHAECNKNNQLTTKQKRFLCIQTK